MRDASHLTMTVDSYVNLSEVLRSTKPLIFNDSEFICVYS